MVKLQFEFFSLSTFICFPNCQNGAYINFGKEKHVLSNTGSSDFPGGTMVKNLPANAGNTGSSPGPGRSHMPRSN